MAAITIQRPDISIADPEVQRFLNEKWTLIQEQFAPLHVILFGSRANGTPHEGSDIDLIIVSERFANMRLGERRVYFRHIVQPRCYVDALCYTPEEFERIRRHIGVVADACREGVWLRRGELKQDWEVTGVATLDEQIEWWLREAEHDLEMAKSNRQNGFYNGCVLMSQQSAEKYLKALYLYTRKATPPKTHKVDELAKTLGAPFEVVDATDEMEKEYMRSRYPDAAGGVPYELYDDAKAQEHLDAAEQVKTWVLQQLGKSP
jgi:hypothetical protein